MDTWLKDVCNHVLETMVECKVEEKRIDSEVKKIMDFNEKIIGVDNMEKINNQFIDVISDSRLNAYYMGVKHACKMIIGLILE